jgi:hypothetical protein
MSDVGLHIKHGSSPVRDIVASFNKPHDCEYDGTGYN